LQQPTLPGRRWPWIRLFGRNQAEGDAPDDAQRGYVEAALVLLARCEALHRDWLEQVDEQRRNERLANAAAVYHWHLRGLLDRLAAVEVPRALDAWHEALTGSLESAASATRLMSHGYRFNNVRRICDGGARLEDALGQAVAVRDALVRVYDLSPVGAHQPAERATGA